MRVRVPLDSTSLRPLQGLRLGKPAYAHKPPQGKKATGGWRAEAVRRRRTGSASEARNGGNGPKPDANIIGARTRVQTCLASKSGGERYPGAPPTFAPCGRCGSASHRA